MRPGRPLSVAVLVDLEWRADSGGQVKCWDRLAEAAVGLGGQVDLTVHFSCPPGEGPPPVRVLGDNVRYRFHPPRFSTRRLPFLSAMPDHADLGRFHRGLAAHLAGADVVHTTDAYFTFARTAGRWCRERAIPLTTSIHTDTPAYAGLYTASLVERLSAALPPARWLLRGARLAERVEAGFERALRDHLRACAMVLVSRPQDRERALGCVAADRVGFLRRGVDRDLFTPEKRDRAWLGRAFAVPGDAFLVLFVGRVDRGKNALPLARAVHRLAAAGRPVHLFCAGAGDDRAAIAGLLGGGATCPGHLDQATLARVYACADLLAAPSAVETLGNVVLEAAAAGLPAVVNGRSGMGRVVTAGEDGLVVDGSDPSDWAAALDRAMADRGALAAMGRTARRRAEARLPTWRLVVEEDLLPAWDRAAGGRGAGRRAA
ncbi:MAG: glycosyltransferase [Hyphomicrobiales bacterium]|nr:glycosyltransferase [Hyphomicrobiales bacterium]